MMQTKSYTFFKTFFGKRDYGKLLLTYFFVAFTLLLSSCAVGPNYVRPFVNTPVKFKEADKNWKVAHPSDEEDRGDWWEVFHNPELDVLETKVNVSNQNIKVAVAQYQQAIALVREAQAAYFPVVAGSVSVTRQKQSTLVTSTSGGTSSVSTGRTVTDYLLSLNASWVPDLWGGVRRQVESNKASAQASAAQLAGVRLSMQGTLAQDYFQLRALDADQKLLNNTVIAYQKALRLVKDQHAAGVASLADIAQAQAQLKTAQALAIDNGINRAQFEHAIAVLIGQPASTFSLAPKVITLNPPTIPVAVPSTLLERRPDIAQAERQMAAANALIGVAIAAYFPTLTLSGSYGYETFDFAHWISQPALFWSVGPQLAETIFDGGLRRAQVAAARASYRQMVATYRQTVLAAFQNVEDNLAALRLLRSEAAVQHQAVAATKFSLKLLLSQYQAGTVAYTNVIVAQNAAYSAQKTESDIAGRRMVAAVGLIMALGGGWDAFSN